MTISSTTRQAGPFTGNGIATTFPFTFKTFDTTDLVVIRTNTSGIDSTLALGTDYSVILNSNQNVSPGGSIILVVALAVGFKMTATTDLANLQPTDLTNQGGFYPDVINESLDRATIQIQQNSNALNRSVKFPISDGSTDDILLPAKDARKGRVLAFDEVTGLPLAGPSIADVGTVAGNTTNIGIVATNIDDVIIVADNISNVNTVAGSITNVSAVAAIDSDVTAVAAVATDIGTVASNIANVNTVAINSSNINTVAANDTDISTAADNIAAIIAAPTEASNAASSASSALGSLNSFKGQYYGALASNPALDPLGDPVGVGDLYLNTTVPEMRVYDGAAWVAAYASLGDALLSANNLSELTDVAVARTNLGLSDMGSL